jgi:hypothetical protein
VRALDKHVLANMLDTIGTIREFKYKHYVSIFNIVTLAKVMQQPDFIEKFCTEVAKMGGVE